MEIMLSQCALQVVTLPQGGKMLRATEPQGNVVNIPMDDKTAREIAAGLNGIAVASGPLPTMHKNGA